MRLQTSRIRRTVSTFVVVYAALTAYATVAGDGLAALATELSFGLVVLGFGTLLLVRARGVRLVAAGGPLAVGGGLEIVGAIVPALRLLADAPVVAGLGLYAYERWIRRGTSRPDPLEPKNA